MELKIDQTAFEAVVPAFTNPDGQVFERMDAFLADAQEAVERLLDGFEPGGKALQGTVRLVCLMAARRAVPQLDLVLTPTGFGVVSNQNTAPASRERVAALLERLRKDESVAADRLQLELVKTGWADTTQAAARVNSLLWLPLLMRAYGVRMPDGREVYHEEYRKLQAELSMAEPYVTGIVSGALYEKLVALQRTGTAESPYGLVTEQARRLLAALLMSRSYPRAPRKLAERLLDTLQRNADLLPEYKDSPTYAAHTFKPYENKKEDSSFFFG